jgi:hypothetical protein
MNRKERRGKRKRIEVKLSIRLIKYHVMKTYWEVEIWFHTFSTSIVGEDE